MDEQINAIINNLCDRFGVTVQFLIPEIAKYQIAVCGIGMLGGLIGMMFFIALSRKSLRNARDAEDPDSGWSAAMTVSIGMTFVCALVFAFNLADVVGWMASPYGAMVKMLLQTLK